MAAYCKLLFAVAIVFLTHTAVCAYVAKRVIDEPLYGRQQSAEERYYSHFAEEQDSGYDDYDDFSEMDEAEEENYYDDEDYEYEADAADYGYVAEEKYEMAVEQAIGGVKTLKDALEYGIDNLRKLGSNAVCSTVKGRCNNLQSQNMGTCITSGSETTFTAAENKKVPLTSFIEVNVDFHLYLVYTSYDCASHDINVTVSSDVQLTIIPSYMNADKFTASIAARVTSPLDVLGMKIRGNWNIGSLVIIIAATYDTDSSVTHISARPSSGTSLASFIKAITGLSLPVSSSTRVSFQFDGKRESSGATTLTLVSDRGSVKFFAVYQSLSSGSAAAKAIAVEVPELRLSSVIKQYVGMDISSIPFFGTFSVPEMGMAYSTAAVRGLGNLFQNTQLLNELDGQIESGFSAYIEVPFHSNPLYVIYSQKMLVMTTPQKNLRLTNVLEYLASGGGNWKVSLPSQLSSIFSLYIDEIAIKGSVTTVNVTFPSPVVFFSGFLSVSEVKAAIVIQSATPKVSAAISGNIQLAGGTFVTSLAQNSQLKYVLSAIGDQLAITSLLQTLGAEVLPSSIASFLQNIPFLKFTIKKPSISYTIGVSPTQMHIGGTPVVQGFSVSGMDTLVAESNGMKVILGFKLTNTNFASLLQKVTGFDFGRFPLLSQSIPASVIISSLTSNSLRFSGSLASLPIRKGVTLSTSMTFPSNCGSDIFCKYAGILIGSSTSMSLQATILSSSFFPVSASLSDLSLGTDVTLSKAGLEIVGGTSASIGLVGEVALKNPPLIFGAKISAGTKGLTCQLSVSNCWDKPFGADFLSICNLIGSIDFAPPTGITGIAFGAEIHLGYESSGHQIEAKGYVGVSIINPVENYYYVEFSSVTIGSLLKAFKISASVPTPLANSGFPNGFLSSFSAQGEELPEVGVSIPAGFRLKGKLDILGLQGSADITLNLPSLIDVSVALPPIKVGSLLAMYYSSSDTSRGPYLKAKVQTVAAAVNLQASGYLKVLGISIDTELKVTNTQYIYSFRGRMLDLFYASLEIVASYGSISKASFTASGTFEADLINGIQDLVKNAVNGIGSSAKKSYDAAYSEAKKLVDTYTSQQKSAQNKVDQLQDEVNKLYKQLFIAKVMVSCPTHDCRRKASKQGWKKVRKGINKGTKSVTKGVEKGVDYTTDALKKEYNKAVDSLNDAKNELSSVTKKLNDAKSALNNVANKFKDGLQIYNYIVKHGLDAIISIRSISFSVSLAVANSGHFSCGVNVQILGASSQTFSLSINLRSLSGVADNLKDKVVSAFKSLG